jgi:hypothetical protein
MRAPDQHRPTPIRLYTTAQARFMACLVMSVVLGWLVSGCVQTTPNPVKIGLVAPFEGRYREIGYDVIPAARLAIREWAMREESRRVPIELVAYDDMGDPALAMEQAKKLAVDPKVVVVIGHWRDDTTQAALPIYADAGLPLIVFSTESVDHTPGVHNLAPSGPELASGLDRWAAGTGDAPSVLEVEDIVTGSAQIASQPGDAVVIPGINGGLRQFYALAAGSAKDIYFASGAAKPGDQDSDYWTAERLEAFTSSFKEGSLGAPPGLLSVSAYEATWLAIKEIAASRGIDIARTPVDAFEFDSTGRRIDAPIYLYAWRDGERQFIQQLR